MSRWTDYRVGRRPHSSHGARQGSSQPASPPFNIDSSASPEIQSRQIRLLLQELGLGYSCLALYLSSRIDLLPAEFCREFALTPDQAPPLPASDVHRILTKEFQAEPQRSFREFNDTPIGSTLVAQSHNAMLANGMPVVVFIRRPEYDALAGATGVPQSFNKAVVQEHCGRVVTEGVLGDFFTALRRKSDFAVQRETMHLMAHGAASSDVFRARKTYRELSTHRVLTLEHLEESTLDECLLNHSCNTDALAGRLCHVWLVQALCGHGFPVDPQFHNITLVDNVPLFTSCDFIGLPQGTKENLWNYLAATVADDPDNAVMYLLREMWPTQRTKIDSEAFRSQFRQSAYFGALEPVLGTNSNALAQLIFQHWKTALEYGYMPKPHLLCFYRGIFSIARTAWKLSPLGDPLREGMEEVRADRVLNQVQEITDWRYWLQNSDKFATALMNLPKIMDDALGRASTPGRSVPGDQPDVRSKRTGRSSANMVLIVVIVAMFLVVQPSGMGPMTEKFTVLLLLLAGILALRGSAD